MVTLILLPLLLGGDSPAESRAKSGIKRLEASAAGRVVLRAIERHGGLEAWYGGRALRFRYDYKPVDTKKTRRDTLQTVDLLRSRAYHEVYEPVSGRMAFDGEVAWSTFEPNLIAARFWCLTPYYFVAMPFVFADPGVQLEIVAEDPTRAGLPASTAVRVTFGNGVGDAPDDFYIAYFDDSDGHLLAVRYVVTYKPFFVGSEVSRGPEKLLVFEDQKQVGPLMLSHRHVFFDFSAGERGKKITDGPVSDFVYAAPFDESQLKMPEGATVDRSLDALK